jgi:hypothetical protein
MTEPSPPTGALPARVPLGSLPLPYRFELPAPPGTVPLPNRFYGPMAYVLAGNHPNIPDREVVCADAIEQLPETTEAILSAEDRARACLILRAPYFFREADEDPLEDYTTDLFRDAVRPLQDDLAQLALQQERLQRATTQAQRTRLHREIAKVQATIDQRHAKIAQDTRDSLHLFEDRNGSAYHYFCWEEKQNMPQEIEEAIASRNHAMFLAPLQTFVVYASYATREVLVRILDRLAVAFATVPLPPAFSELSTQLINIRNNCAIIDADPRATPPLLPHNITVGVTYELLHCDFVHFAEHMMRRARERAWDRVRDRFADRLANWAQRYPEVW